MHATKLKYEMHIKSTGWLTHTRASCHAEHSTIASRVFVLLDLCRRTRTGVQPSGTTSRFSFVSLGSMLLALTACASSGDDREALEARYQALEDEQIRSLTTEDAQRRAEMLDPTSSTGDRFVSMDRNEESLAPGVKISAVPLSPDSADRSNSTFDRGWLAGSHPDPKTGEPVCAMLSPAAAVMNGELATEVFVMITSTSVYLRTDATLDPDNSAYGLSIDDTRLLGFESLLNDVTAIVAVEVVDMIPRLIDGRRLVASFRYSPQQPDKTFHSVEFDLDGIEDAWNQLNRCSQSDIGAK